MKLVGLGEPTSFPDHVYWGCTQRECKPNENKIDEYRKMFESRIAPEKLPGWEKPLSKNGRVVLRYGRTCSKVALRDIANWRSKRQSCCTKFQVLAWTTIMSRRRNWNQLETVKSMLTDCLEIIVFGTNG